MPDDAAEIPDVLQQYGLATEGTPEHIALGTLNWNYRVRASGRDYFVRRHRDDQPLERILAEHDALAFAEEHRIPVARPLPSRDGRTVVRLGDANWAVFPWVEGRPPVRGAMTDDEVHAVGLMHGRLHRVLASYPLQHDGSFPMEVDLESVASQLGRAISSAQHADADDYVVEAMRLQLSLLTSEALIPTEEFARRLVIQPVHGDYHELQLLFDSAGRIALVADWEIFGIRPRGYELVRALSFGWMLGTPRQATYLAAYREHVTLPEDEARAAIEFWLQSRIVNTWLWTAYFLEGNQRVVEFFPRAAANLKQLTDPGWRERSINRFVEDALG